MDLESLLYPLRTILNGYIALLNTLLFYGLLSPKLSCENLWSSWVPLCCA